MENDTTIDPAQDQADLEGQQAVQEQGNDQGQGDQGQSQQATDFIDFKGVKIPASEFETLAKEKYKDAFESHENRSKWQAENTRKAMELAQDKRDAEEFRRLRAERENPRENQDPIQKAKQEYIQDMKKDFPELSDRFLEKQFDWQMKLAGQSAEQVVNPINEERGRAFEEKFLAEHPKVQKGSVEYQKIAQYIGAGVNAEDAYNLTFPQDRIESEIKKRNEDAARKLKQSRTQSTPAQVGKLKGKDVFESNWDKYGDK